MTTMTRGYVLYEMSYLVRRGWYGGTIGYNVYRMYCDEVAKGYTTVSY